MVVPGRALQNAPAQGRAAPNPESRRSRKRGWAKRFLISLVMDGLGAEAVVQTIERIIHLNKPGWGVIIRALLVRFLDGTAGARASCLFAEATPGFRECTREPDRNRPSRFKPSNP